MAPFRLLSVLLFFIATATPADQYVPAALQEWTNWVTAPHKDFRCPIHSGKTERFCAWPGTLSLTLDESGGRFRQNWAVFGETAVPLPGASGQWPTKVKVDGSPEPVVDVNGQPTLYLKPGQYRIEGQLHWSSLPKRLRLPEVDLLLTANVRGESLVTPYRRNGYLLLGDAPSAAPPSVRNTLNLRVERLIRDGQPLLSETRLTLEVAGQPREIDLGRPLLDGFRPMELSGDLSARIDAHGHLLVHVRPGRYTLILKSYAQAPLSRFTPPTNPPPWPSFETWAFAAASSVRTVRPQNAMPLDPRQTLLPKNWQHYPVFRVDPEHPLVLKVLHRGEPTPPEDRATLKRILWLDFSGKKFTAQDRIQANLHQRWRLQALPGISLGRVSIDNQDRLITKLPGEERPGIEVRQGRAQLVAESRFPLESNLFVSGWDLPFQQVSTELRLPPGWRLLATEGVEQETASWLRQWRIYDLFLLFLIAFGAGRLWGWMWTPVALLGLGLAWHEAPGLQGIWLYLLVLSALRRALPSEGRLPSLLRTLWLIGVISLSVSMLVFSIGQVRAIFYPQLETVSGGHYDVTSHDVLTQSPKDKNSVRRYSEKMLARYGSATVPSAPRQKWTPDPTSSIQTGPGLPSWSWHVAPLNWTSPVAKAQAFRLHLLSPGWVRLLRFLMLLLIALLLWRFIAYRGKPRPVVSTESRARGVAMLAFAMALCAAPQFSPANTEISPAPVSNHSWGFPGTALLNELESRLTRPPDCLPNCASIEQMTLDITGSRIRLVLRIHARERVAIPIPVGDYALQSAVTGGSTLALRREHRNEWLLLAEPGVNDYILKGVVADRDRLILSLPFRPHRVQVQVDGWTVEGIGPNGSPDSQLVLVRTRRIQMGESGKNEKENVLYPLLRLTRHFHIGKEWRIDYRLQRLSSGPEAVAFPLPLLPGEQVLDEHIRVRKGAALIRLPAGQSLLTWQSRLPLRDQLSIKAHAIDGVVETWRFDVSPDWHFSHSGFPPVHQQDNGRLLPTYLPWPGDHLVFDFVRPKAIPGRTFTISEVRLNYRPGRQRAETELHLKIRASRGTEHRILLPEGAVLDKFAQDGRSLPTRVEGRSVRLSLHPGEQTFHLQWHQSQGIANSWHPDPPHLKAPSVNIVQDVVASKDRWVLWTHGPVFGPAVLFWGIAGVVLVLALILGRWKRITPLGASAWFLLGLGLLQSSLEYAVLVMITLFALAARERIRSDRMRPLLFDTMQVTLGLLSIAGVLSLFAAVEQGLLGFPQMQILGPGSSTELLHWYQDRSADALPRISVLSLPLWLYRALMLFWALWLAYAVVHWSRWAWSAFTREAAWKPLRFSIRSSKISKKAEK